MGDPDYRLQLAFGGPELMEDKFFHKVGRKMIESGSRL